MSCCMQMKSTAFEADCHCQKAHATSPQFKRPCAAYPVFDYMSNVALVYTAKCA
ncbi:hypothetical protein EGR_09264 [Echinococcus granulosus]|uniref:Uncharacterized protein n=1 Tax=Echinococcus granulosus TaxID=6210 RepID=W6U5K2_ECHGR|nr:hypothetical protein EGR_09264 [Echinococcus granulosus]EUB55861.1 hypothetical protein EGR_09264 [Echinococcus granulosus]